MYMTTRNAVISLLAAGLVLTSCSDAGDPSGQSSVDASADSASLSNVRSERAADEIRESAFDIAHRSGRWQIEQFGAELLPK